MNRSISMGCTASYAISPPQPFEPDRIAGGVFDVMFNLPVAEIVLNEPRICALIGKRETAGVAAACADGQSGEGSGATRLQKQIDGRVMQRLAVEADEKPTAGGFHLGTDFQPCADGLELVVAKRLRCR